MATVCDEIECPQCGHGGADHEFNCRNSGESTACRRCGYEETWEPKHGDDGKHCGWKHDISRGFGALWYRSAGAPAFFAHYLRSAQQVADAERWLREALDKRQVDSEVSYLTRWNGETKQVEFVIGSFYEWPESDWSHTESTASVDSQQIEAERAKAAARRAEIEALLNGDES